MPPPLEAPSCNATFPQLAFEAFRLERALRPGRDPSSTIAVNKKAQFLPHVDSGAGAGQGISLIVGLGNYTGGELVVEGVVHDIRYKPVEFNGWAQRHWTRPFAGERFSLVWFTPVGCEGRPGLEASWRGASWGLGLLDGVGADGVGRSRRIADASAMRLGVAPDLLRVDVADAPPMSPLHRRCIADTAPMHRRCIGDAARSSNPICSCPHLGGLYRGGMGWQFIARGKHANPTPTPPRFLGGRVGFACGPLIAFSRWSPGARRRPCSRGRRGGVRDSRAWRTAGRSRESRWPG
ncbi:unnamed protein product [Prorocentrum cordatum]|uniref:Uncharacterized protein n=1 Tax=Prorocentrum cordatum TaxID=2364126 RepID=A0ABN9WWU9_9DINO|nr:unnamed protein product [Polarella glacialis]